VKHGLKSRWSAWLALTLALAGVLALASCSDNRSATEPDSAGKSANDSARLFSISNEQMAHIQVVTVQPSDLPRVLRLSGTVAYNGFRTTPVITQVSGPISRILSQPGELVKQNQPMLYVASPDFAQNRANYLKARDAFILADKNYVRSVDLYNHHAIAERDLQAAESARTQAQADMVAAEQSLKILGANPATVLKSSNSPEIPLLAPLGGEVVERLCSPGQLIQAGTTQCFTLSDMSTVWVLSNVFQDALSYVHVGDPVTIQSEAYPDVFHGTISFIAAALDPASRTLQARIVTQNPGGKLKKDMYVTTVVRAGSIRNALAVPDSAILRDTENEPFVYVAANQAGNQFARRPVKIGESQNGSTHVVSGLQPGARVVGDGSLFLQFANSLQR
jgi:membrane fusion protein, heavy metal efflux system